MDAVAPCIGLDPLCPCQDGLACHYRDSVAAGKVTPAAFNAWTLLLADADPVPTPIRPIPDGCPWTCTDSRICACAPVMVTDQHVRDDEADVRGSEA